MAELVNIANQDEAVATTDNQGTGFITVSDEAILREYGLVEKTSYKRYEEILDMCKREQPHLHGVLSSHLGYRSPWHKLGLALWRAYRKACEKMGTIRDIDIGLQFCSCGALAQGQDVEQWSKLLCSRHQSDSKEELNSPSDNCPEDPGAIIEMLHNGLKSAAQQIETPPSSRRDLFKRFWNLPLE